MSLDDVYLAIEAGKIEEARGLLRPLMNEDNVEAFQLASRVAYTQEQALEFLRYALQLAPDNEAVRLALHKLEALYQSQSAIVPIKQESIAIKEKLDQTAAIFVKHGWQLVEQDDDMIHLTRRRSMSASSAFIMSMMFHVFGVLLTFWTVLTSEKIHVFIEADEDALLITSNKTERLITKPQQAILIVESMRGITIRQAIFWSLLGVTISSIGLYGLLWYANHSIQSFEQQIRDLQATATHPPI